MIFMLGSRCSGERGSEFVTTSSRIGDSLNRLEAGPHSTACVVPT